MFKESTQNLLDQQGREAYEMIDQDSRSRHHDGEGSFQTAHRDEESQRDVGEDSLGAAHREEQSQRQDGGESRESIHLDDGHQPDLETISARLLPLFALILPTAAVIALWTDRDYIHFGELVDFVQEERPTVQLVVQIVSRVLAMLQMTAVCSILNFAVRVRLGSQGGSINLQALGFWSSLNVLRINFSLSAFYVLGTAGFLAVSLLPGALWAGTLSPVLGTMLDEREIRTPAFTGRSTGIWNSQYVWKGGPSGSIWDIDDHCRRINDYRGFIPSCPVPDLQSLLLSSGGSATPVDGSVRIHSKLDNPFWQYRGRSYGVGSSMGLNSTLFFANEDTYKYTEMGYNVTVSCMKNSSSNFGLQFDTTSGSLYKYDALGQLPNMYSAKPNGDDYEESAYAFSLYNNTDMATWTAYNSNSTLRNMIGVATTYGRYQNLNQTQCEVHFVPAEFVIAVNQTEGSISVESRNSDAVRDIDPTGQLQFVIMNSVNFLARMSTSLYVSVLGDCLNRNFQAKMSNAKQKKSSLTDEEVEEAATSSAADTFTAIIDDILVAYGASQLVNAGDYTTTFAYVSSPAVQIGKWPYVYLIAAFHFGIVSLWLIEAVRTRGWARLPKFDHLDVGSVIVASSAGGHQLAQTVQKHHRAKKSRWAGDKSDRIVAQTEIRLKRQKLGTSLNPSDGHNASRGEGDDDDMIAIVRKSP
ncbi:hypothetical protein MMC07_007183 [Pseudocyphellaria aurata]|nr:hypothetical protein [Pseudocyphellaria aurata]